MVFAAFPSTAGPPDRPSFDCVASSESVVPPATGARLVHVVGFFPSDCGLRQQEMARRAPSPPANDFTRVPIFDAAGILFDYDPLVHSPPWSFPRNCTRRGLCRCFASVSAIPSRLSAGGATFSLKIAIYLYKLLFMASLDAAFAALADPTRRAIL